MKTYAIRVSRTSTPLFGHEQKEIVNWYAIEASDAETAVTSIIRTKHSVGDLRDGVTCEVYEVNDFHSVWRGQYDKEPMVDHSATDAELVIARRLDLEPALREHLDKAQR